MSDETAKIRFKIGQLEVEYEGSTSFLEEGLLNLMKQVIDVHRNHKDAISADPPPAGANGAGQGDSAIDLNHSTNTLATHLNATTGTEIK